MVIAENVIQTGSRVRLVDKVHPPFLEHIECLRPFQPPFEAVGHALCFAVCATHKHTFSLKTLDASGRSVPFLKL